VSRASDISLSLSPSLSLISERGDRVSRDFYFHLRVIRGEIHRAEISAVRDERRRMQRARARAWQSVAPGPYSREPPPPLAIFYAVEGPLYVYPRNLFAVLTRARARAR